MKLTFDMNNFFTTSILITFLVAAAVSAATQNWSDLLVALITGGVTWLPVLLPKKFNFIIPKRFLMSIVLFLFASLFLGEFHDFYERFWWWDILLHSFSAFAFGMLGIVLVLIIHHRDRVKASPLLLACFAFSFAMSIGAVWEIVEFIIDQLFGANMQKSGLVDTMWDLIVDGFGAVAAAVYGYYFWRLNSKQRSVANDLRQLVANNTKRQ